jgi:hypothetical protein
MPASVAAAPSRRGLTLVETAIAGAIVTVLLAAIAPVLSTSRSAALRTISLKNLTVLGEAHACYGADWNDRQFSTSPGDMGQVSGNCGSYLYTIGCPNPVALGWSSTGGLWGFFLGSSGTCSEYGYPGSCVGWTAYRPIDFSGGDFGFGGFRLANVRGFQEYVEGAYYRPRWFSALDVIPYKVAEPFFSVQEQFPGITYPGGLRFSSYCNSPAALYQPEVFRRPSQGGFRNPNLIATAFDVPTQAQCLHPELKSRMVEHHWLVNPPAETNPAWGEQDEPYYFNHGIDSRPGVLFFDGSVEELTMTQAVEDDAAALKASGGIDGLWSRDTPFGPDGYFGGLGYDETRNSFHIFTTDGILGRDILRREGGRP